MCNRFSFCGITARIDVASFPIPPPQVRYLPGLDLAVEESVERLRQLECSTKARRRSAIDLGFPTCRHCLFQDDATAFNAKKKARIGTRGNQNKCRSCSFVLETQRVKKNLVRRLEDREMVVASGCKSSGRTCRAQSSRPVSLAKWLGREEGEQRRGRWSSTITSAMSSTIR